jgi:predicted AAA+ superfamily ATPase
MLDLVKTLHTEFQFRLSEVDEHWVERAVTLPDEKGKATVAIGMRRSGKTFALFQTIKKLLASNVSPSRILYVDFEDDRLQPLDQKGLAKLLDGFYSLFPNNHDQLCYLFLDEIHTVEEWPLVIRRFLNTKNVRIYLSGSSAKMLSKEIATSLRGRALTVEIWPYSFYEYLRAKGESGPEKVMSRPELDKYRHELRHFLDEGGFPEVVGKSQLTRTRILQDYVSVVTYRDIVERHKVENIALINYMINFLTKNAATSYSANKMYNTFKSQGFSVGRSTVYDYLSYIEDAFLSFTVPLFSESVRQVQNNPKKLYSIDCGLVNAHQLVRSPDYGHLFENLIYLDLRRRGDEIYYYFTNERYEVDFLSKSLDGQVHLYQVAWNMEDPDTRMREERALKAAEKELGITGSIITETTYFDWLANLYTHIPRPAAKFS